MKKSALVLFGCFFMLTVLAQEIKYSSCNDCWNSDSLGNHRAVVQFNGEGKLAKLVIPWRRRDADPQNKRIIIEDAQTKQKILNIKTGILTRESGEIYFEPVSGKGTYYVYYLPYKNEGRSNYPKGVYLKPENAASPGWLNLINDDKNIPQATVAGIESINDFNSFYPMEVIATETEKKDLIAAHAPASWLVFPEDRLHPIKMTNDIPQRWIQKGIQANFYDTVAKGENFSFQLGIWALEKLEDIKITFTDLVAGNGSKITAKSISCINTEGTSYDAKPLHFSVSIPAGKIQPLWCIMDIPSQIPAGTYKGTATLAAGPNDIRTVQLNLTVSNKSLTNGGIDEPVKMTRLKWLNSRLAQDNAVIDPYTPLKVKDKTINLLGRNIELNADGFPKQIQTFFTPEMTAFSRQPKNILTAPIRFHVAGSKEELQWKTGKCTFTSIQPGTVKWKSVNVSDALQMDVNASMEFDGFISYTVKITALNDVQVSDMGLSIPFAKNAARYLMGLGQKGGYRPASFDWKWEVAIKNQDGAWIGDVNAGLQFSLRDEKYIRPLNTNFYLQKPLLLPSSWGNSGKGGIHIKEEGNTVMVDNYSGDRELKKGDTLYYNFTLLITPFHTINTDFQWRTKFYHKYNNLDTIKATGATVVNIHHATPINPWINYPFIEYKKMRAYIEEAHSKGLKVKIYNTVRELSNRAYETFPMRSLGHEIYSPGKGGGFSWLQEHVGEDYIAAWFVPEIKDAAIVNSGMSRWHNYYVEGMNWLVQNVGIDGIYLDDVAFDRITMKRIKRVLTRDGHPGIIDLHSANQFNKNDGFNNSANLYMEHFPYLNRLWFGEYFDYEKGSPDFFLTEVSGIPFGLMGEMLQDGGNPWRGMIYGMTNRMPWSDNADPRPIWNIWNQFGMQGTAMIGYWSENCPVKTDNDKVLVTVYKKKGAALVSIASWADSDVEVQLKIDWKKLGIDPAKATITAPAANNFQPARTFKLNEKIPVEKRKGWLLIIK